MITDVEDWRIQLNPKKFDNPYRPPRSLGPTSLLPARNRDGFIWLVCGTILMIGALSFIAYLMIHLVPEIKAGYTRQNLSLQPGLYFSIHVVDFLVKYWFIWPAIIVGGVLANEIMTPRDLKRILRIRIGIVLGCFALASVAWMSWITYSAMN